MSKRTTASAVIKLMTPAQRLAMLTMFYDHWESLTQDYRVDEEADRLGVTAEDISEAAGLISREWDGVTP